MTAAGGVVMSFRYFETKQLEAFYAVISIGSMTGAAKALGRSQSVITRLVQELEIDIGFQLLHRNGPRISPTAQGLAFFEQAEVFLSGLRAISDKADAIARTAPPSIEIASVAALASSVLPSALAKIAADLLPDNIHVQSISADNVVQAVAARTADLGLASWPFDNPGVEVHFQAEVPCRAVVAVEHPLADHAVIRPQDLRDQRLIVAANPYRLRMQIDQALAANGIPKQAVIDSNATYVSMALARKSLGVAIVEPLTGAGLQMTGLRSIALSFPVMFRWSVVTAVGRPLSPPIEAIIQQLRLVAETEIDDLVVLTGDE